MDDSEFKPIQQLGAVKIPNIVGDLSPTDGSWKLLCSSTYMGPDGNWYQETRRVWCAKK
jgi:hypothetical protein